MYITGELFVDKRGLVCDAVFAAEKLQPVGAVSRCFNSQRARCQHGVTSAHVLTGRDYKAVNVVFNGVTEVLRRIQLVVSYETFVAHADVLSAEDVDFLVAACIKRIIPGVIVASQGKTVVGFARAAFVNGAFVAYSEIA